MTERNKNVKLSIEVNLNEYKLEVLGDAFDYRASGCGIEHFIPALVNALGCHAHIRAMAIEYAAFGDLDFVETFPEEISRHDVDLPADKLDALLAEIGMPGDLSPKRKLESFVQRFLDYMVEYPVYFERFLEQMIDADTPDEPIDPEGLDNNLG